MYKGLHAAGDGGGGARPGGYIHICIHTYNTLCMYMCIYIHIYIYVCIHIYIYTYLSLYIYIYIHT